MCHEKLYTSCVIKSLLENKNVLQTFFTAGTKDNRVGYSYLLWKNHQNNSVGISLYSFCRAFSQRIFLQKNQDAIILWSRDICKIKKQNLLEKILLFGGASVSGKTSTYRILLGDTEFLAEFWLG